jgi:hypothetical protein
VRQAGEGLVGSQFVALTIVPEGGAYGLGQGHGSAVALKVRSGIPQVMQ